MTHYQFAEVERDGPIMIVTMNRPEVMNALHYPAHGELDRIFSEFAEDADQWVAIITGAGSRAFCAGHDLKSQAQGGELKSAETGFAGLTRRFDLNKPVIAAVNGVAVGGGFEVALACDIIIAAETASFALPEPRVGLAALAGGLHRLPRAIGIKRAMEMILTSRRVSATEGERLGFVNRVVAADELIEAAKAMAREICAASPASIRASKEAVLFGLEETLSDAIAHQRDYPAMKAMFASDDFIEGPRAFAEKRPPVWSGR